MFFMFADPNDFVAMPQGQKVSPELQWAIIRLSKMISNDQIAIGLNLSTRTVRHVLSYFNANGNIPYPEEKPTESEKKGSRHLRDVDVEVSAKLVKCSVYHILL